MGHYSVSVTPAFKREFRKLERKTQKRVLDALEKLAKDPRPRGIEKLKQNPRFYRLTIGDHRVIYAVDDKSSVIVACLVRHRKDAYRDIEKLDVGVMAEALKPILVQRLPTP